MDKKLYTADWKEILNGEATDIYFYRTKKILEKAGLKDKKVRAELHVYGLPKGFEWAIFAGIEEAVNLFEGRNVTVYSLLEGTVFREKQPLMMIEGPYYEFVELETALLGILRHYTSIATKAARIKMAAGDKTVLFFGLRSLHPILAPMADRAALIGGVDGVSGILSEKYNGVEPTGTMPHGLIVIVGDQEKAWLLFDKYIEDDVPRIMLVDTFWDERIEALKAAKALGEKLYGVRIDTPGSRRGNIRKIVEEVRWALDLEGYNNVKIYVSGGLNEDNIVELRDIVDGFGVGTSIAFPPSIDISMDIVEVYENNAWLPRCKRGKLPGAKKLYRCDGLYDIVLPWEANEPRCPNGEKPFDLLKKVVDNGRIVLEPIDLEKVRTYVKKQLGMIRGSP